MPLKPPPMPPTTKLMGRVRVVSTVFTAGNRWKASHTSPTTSRMAAANTPSLTFCSFLIRTASLHLHVPAGDGVPSGTDSYSRRQCRFPWLRRSGRFPPPTLSGRFPGPGASQNSAAGSAPCKDDAPFRHIPGQQVWQLFQEGQDTVHHLVDRFPQGLPELVLIDGHPPGGAR